MTRVAASVLLLLLQVAGSGHGRAPQAAAESPRVRLTINDGWRYVDGDRAGAESPSFDDSAWEAVSLPHTWNAADAFAEPLDYRRGIGWYRKRLILDESLRGRRLFLFFEAANQVADVFVNGAHAGNHTGGYTAFAFDVTELLRLDGQDLVAVRVDNRHDDDIPPLNADFTFYGGIYRDAWLVATSSVHITLLDHASPGIFIDAPEVTDTHAVARIRGSIVNHGPGERRVEVINRVVDPNGHDVATTRSEFLVPPAGTVPFVHLTARIPEPRLWSPAEPNLYSVITDVRVGGSLVDRTLNPLGFRWFRVDPDSGFFLNGRPHPLYGTNRHQDRAGRGSAVADAAHRQDVALVSATGFNFLRLAHYPQDPAVLEHMDRTGLIGWEEIPVVNIISLTEAFAANAERMLVEMIRQHYNHPSIIFWGYMNEALLRKPSPVPPGYVAAVRQLAERLDARARAEDPGRLTALAVSFDEVDDGSGLQDVPDVLGLNLYFGWYYRSVADFGPYLDSLRARHPRRPLLVSEYGADSDERIHTLEPRAFDFSTEHQQRFHEATFRQILDRPYLVGSAVWNQFDFGSKGRHDSKPNINQKGLLFLDRRPKDVWHYYRAMLIREPVLHIATRDWAIRAGSRPADRIQQIVVYTNAPRVELLVNGTSAGTRTPVNGTAAWTAQLQPGANRLEARGGDLRDAVIVSYEDRSALFRDGPEPAAIAVNAGSHYHFIDEAGTVWEPDRPYTQGSWGYDGGDALLRHHRIFGSPDHPLYQAQRANVHRYRFDVPDGEYDVALRLVELEHAVAGRRVFDLSVNGVAAFRSLDLAAEYGRYRAVERTVVVRAADGGGVTVVLAPIRGAPTISAIMVRRR